MKRSFFRLLQDDGVSAVIVAVSLVGILGGSMLSIDAGSVWSSRRQIITDTDAGALAAARYIDANGPQACNNALSAGPNSGAGREAEFVMTTNDARAYLVDFKVFPYKGDCANEAGHVRVDGRIPANLTFAPVFGIKDVHPFSSSMAQYGPLASAIGVRPIGICDKSPHFKEWDDYLKGNNPAYGTGPEHPSYGTGAVVHRIYFRNQQGGGECGTGSGNWDWLDYNDNIEPNGTEAVVRWLLEGYQQEVSLGDPDTGKSRDCNPEQAGNQEGCPPKTGALAKSVEDALATLRDNKSVVPIAVYDRVVDVRDPDGCKAPRSRWTGSGSNARFCMVAFLMVRFHAWSKITGQTGDDSYMDLEFVDTWWVGSIGGNPSGGRSTTHGVQMCGGNYGTEVDDKCDV